MKTKPIAKILHERKTTHGEYSDHARYTQQIKDTIAIGINDRALRKQSYLSDIQVESLHMIAHKIGRILAGEPNEHDHWHDIAGYATLVVERLDDVDPVLNIENEMREFAIDQKKADMS